MRAGGLWLLTLLLTSGCTAPLATGDAPAPRTIAGYLVGTTVLSGEVLLSGDLLVPAGSSLTLAPGTTLRVRRAEGTKIDPEYLSPATEILVRGSLRILGTAAEPVRIVPEADGDGEAAWAGIVFDGGDGVVSWSEIVAAECGILCIGASPRLEHNTLRRCRYGIVAQHGSAATIVANTVRDGEGGIFCWDGSQPLLRDNRIVDNSEEGIAVDRSSRPQLEGNVVRGNDIGLLLGNCDLPRSGNELVANREDFRCLGAGGGR